MRTEPDPHRFIVIRAQRFHECHVEWLQPMGGPCDSDQTGLSRGLPIHILQSLIMFKYFFCIYLCGSNKWNSDSDSVAGDR